MLRALAFSTLAITLCLGQTISSSSSAIPPKLPAIVIRHAPVIDGTGSPARKNVDVLIQGGRIARVSSGVAGPKGAVAIDARGQFLIPGLWDMHVHVWDADLAFPLFLANGITGVRNMGGHPEDLRPWREEVEKGTRIGPRMIACGPVVDGPPPIHPDHSVVVENAGQARAAIDKLSAEGWDFVKVYDNVPRDAYFAIADEAKKKQIPFVGHVPISVTSIEASDAGQKSIEHLDGFDYVISPLGDQFRRERLERIGKPPQQGDMMKIPMRIADEINRLADTYDEKRAADLFAHLSRNGTWQTPTLSVAHAYGSVGNPAMYQDSRLKYVAQQERDQWEHNPIVHIDIPEYVAARRRAFQQAMRMARSAHAAGVRFLAGTDSGGVPYLYDGFSLHDELALLVDSGFTPMQALQAATRDAGNFLGLSDSGTIEPGKRADLVLLRANPLADIRNTQKIQAVVVDGRLFDRQQLDALLASAEQRAKQ